MNKSVFSSKVVWELISEGFTRSNIAMTIAITFLIDLATSMGQPPSTLVHAAKPQYSFSEFLNVAVESPNLWVCLQLPQFTSDLLAFLFSYKTQHNFETKLSSLGFKDSQTQSNPSSGSVNPKYSQPDDSPFSTRWFTITKGISYARDVLLIKLFIWQCLLKFLRMIY